VNAKVAQKRAVLLHYILHSLCTCAFVRWMMHLNAITQCDWLHTQIVRTFASNWINTESWSFSSFFCYNGYCITKKGDFQCPPWVPENWNCQCLAIITVYANIWKAADVWRYIGLSSWLWRSLISVRRLANWCT